jgi:hypothetical protein
MTDADADAWNALDRELDAWAVAGRTATLWWRDDDAGADHPGLVPLVEIAEGHELVCALAAVPTWVNEALARRVADSRALSVLQHGYNHANHAPRGQGLGAWELGLHRPKAEVLDDLAAGRRLLRQAMGDRFLPVIAPPWNHIDPDLYPDLPALGFIGLSVEGDPPPAEQRHGLRFANVHADPIKWKGGPFFKGAGKTIGALVDDLAHRRTQTGGEEAPTGLVTHHKDSDGACWAFVDRLIARTKGHPAVRWLSPQEIFA